MEGTVKNAELTPKTIDEIANMDCTFRVPSYQRGYRWGEKEVNRLLEDIYENKDSNYCLQPVIVNRYSENCYDIIDGQQRLSTLYLIYKAIRSIAREDKHIDDSISLEIKEQFDKTYKEAMFSICYQSQSRQKVQTFLEEINPNTKNSKENIDCYYMYEAYSTIRKWFCENDLDKMDKVRAFYKAFKENITLIWYELGNDSGKTPEKLFTDINAGKIKLTSSELLKAIFYKQEEKEDILKPDEIAFQWDEIERELHDEAFWSFLTNESGDEYPTRIDLLLELKAEVKKEQKENDKFITFFKLLKKLNGVDDKNCSKSELWKEIVDTFLLLRDWYNNKDFYNKIGYLITTGEKTLLDIYQTYNNDETKDRNKFNETLDGFIKKTLGPVKKNDEEKNYIEWNYDEHSKKIQNLLLLFNVLSVGKFKARRSFEDENEKKSNQNENINKEKFPFDKYKIKTNDKKKRKNIFWSLEHINPQEKPQFSINQDAYQWIKNQTDLFELLIKGKEKEEKDLLEEIKEIKENSANVQKVFKPMVEKMEKLLQVDYENEKNNIENSALLSTHQNAALSNSFFYSKRQKIIEMDKNGEYIPFCTKMVFYKYYTTNASNNIKWEKNDMINYLKEMYCVLTEYLPDEGEAIKARVEEMEYQK